MTEKELLYVEDAIEHEKSIIKIIDNKINCLENEEYVSFLENEKNNHETIMDNLLSLLKEKANG